MYRSNRHGSKKGADFVDGIYVGGSISDYRRKFRQIGRNVLVIVKPSQLTINQLMKDPRQIRDLAKAKGLSATLGAVLSEVMKTDYRKPTTEEMAEYVTARTKLLKYVRVEKEKAAKRKQDSIDQEVLRSMKKLDQHGCITSHDASIRVHIGNNSQAVRDLVNKLRKTRDSDPSLD